MTPVWFNDGSKCVDVSVTEEDCVRCLILEVSLDVFSQTHTCMFVSLPADLEHG